MTRVLAPVLVGLFALLFGLTHAQLSSYLTPADRSAIREKAISRLSAPKCLKGTYYATQALKSSGASVESCNCKDLQGLLSDPSSAFDLYYAKTVAGECNCELKYPQDAVDIARRDLQSNELRSIVGGVLATSAFSQLSADDKSSALSKALNLMTADGTFKSAPEDETGSTANVLLVLDLLAALGGEGGSELAVDVFEKAFNMLPGGSFEGVSDATLMAPLSKLTDKKLRLVGDRLQSVAEGLLNMKHSGCMYCLYRVQEGLNLVAQYKASPLHFSFEQTHFDAAHPQNHKLQLVVRSIVGDAVEVESAEVVAIKTVGRDNAVLQGEKFVGNVLDMSAAGLSAGRYLAQISVNIAGRAKPMTHQAYFVVTDGVAVQDVRFQVVDGDEATSGEAPVVAKQNGLHGVSASAMSGDKVRVTFQVASKGDSTAAPRKPHQAVVRFTHQASGHSVTFTAKKGESAGALGYTATFSVADSIAKFDHQSGPYTVTVLVGDAAYAAPVEWVVGTVELRFPAKQNEHLPLYAKSLLHASDVTLKALPEITHVMRPPAKRASNFMATVFTALVAAPLVVFVLFLLSLRPDLRRLASLPNISALVCLGAMLILYVNYWLALEGHSFYDTIGYLCVFTPVTVVVGSFALGSVKAMRVKAEASKEKQA